MHIYLASNISYEEKFVQEFNRLIEKGGKQIQSKHSFLFFFFWSEHFLINNNGDVTTIVKGLLCVQCLLAFNDCDIY